MADKDRVATLRERLRRHAMGPKGLASIGQELAYAVTDIRQKVVEEATYGRVVTPQPMDAGGIHGRRSEPGGGIHGTPDITGGVHGPADPQGGPPGPQNGPKPPGWDKPPTEKQLALLAKHGMDAAGMTRGTASLAIEGAGYDASWYDDAKRSGPNVSPAFRERCAKAAAQDQGRDGPERAPPGREMD